MVGSHLCDLRLWGFIYCCPRRQTQPRVGSIATRPGMCDRGWRFHSIFSRSRRTATSGRKKRSNSGSLAGTRFVVVRTQMPLFFWVSGARHRHRARFARRSIIRFPASNVRQENRPKTTKIFLSAGRKAPEIKWNPASGWGEVFRDTALGCRTEDSDQK